MEYTEENADLAYQRHPTTGPTQRRVWKTRQAIPDRYFDERKTIRPRVQTRTAVEELKQDRLVLVLSSEKINTTLLWQASNTPGEKWLVTDFVKGRVQLTPAERIGLAAEVQRLRASIRNAIALPPGLLRRKALVKLGQDPRLRKSPCFGPELGRLLAPTRRATADELSREQLQTLEDRLALLALECSL